MAQSITNACTASTSIERRIITEMFELQNEKKPTSRCAGGADGSARPCRRASYLHDIQISPSRSGEVYLRCFPDITGTGRIHPRMPSPLEQAPRHVTASALRTLFDLRSPPRLGLVSLNSRRMSQSSLPTNATQAKDRSYMLLGHSLARLSRAVGQTVDLCEMLKGNLDSMKVLSATHAAQYVLLPVSNYSRTHCHDFQIDL